jgi:predicted nucleotidyltransferase
VNITRIELLARLRSEAQRVKNALPSIRMFAFGSVLRAESWPADVDVLIIYESDPDVALVRALLESLYDELPLHTLYLSTSEEAQLQFVVGEKCLQLA